METAPSDIRGYTVLCLNTSGNDAFASRGQKAHLACTGFLDENNHSVSLRSCADRVIDLTIYKGINHFTESIESFDVTVGLGFSAKGSLGRAKGSASVSDDLKTSFKFNDDGTTHIELSSDLNGEIKGSYKDVGIGYEKGSKQSVTYNWSKNPKKTILAMLLDWFDAMHLTTLEKTLDSMIAIETWFDSKENKSTYFDEVIEKKRSSKYWGVSVEGEWPSDLNDDAGNKIPPIDPTADINNLTCKYSLEGSYKREKEIVEQDDNGKKTYGTSNQLKAKFSADVKSLFEYLVLSHGKYYDVEINGHRYEKKYDHEFGVNPYVVMSSKQEEMYSDILYKNLAKISNTFETEAGIKLSFTSLTDYLCEGWANDEKGKRTISLSGGVA
jgi:hypothetical protein